jgi:hypothetical protein
MTPAPFTPATLRRIRDQRASAHDLGWSEDRYRRVCRTHGYEPQESRAAALEAAPRPDVPFQDIHFAEENGSLTVGAASIMLPTPAAIIIFAALLYRARRGNFDPMVSSAFRGSNHRAWSRGHISRSVVDLNKAINPLGLTVASRPCVGYWLARMDEVQSVASRSRNKTSIAIT